MYFTNRVFFTVVLVLVVTYTTVKYVSFKSSLDHYLEDSYHRNYQNFYAVLETEKRVVKAIALNIANSEIVQRAYRENNSSILKMEYPKILQKLKENSILKEIHFFKPPVISFANISNISASMIDVSDVRKDVDWVIKNYRESNHFMVCRSYGGIRSVQPIIDKKSGSILGALSVGTEIREFPHLFKSISGGDTLFLNEYNITKSLKPRFLKEFLRDTREFDGYIVSSETKKFSIDTLRKIDLSKNYQFLNINGESHAVYIFYLKNFDNTPSYRVVVIENLDSIYSQFKEIIFQEFFINLMVLILIYIILQREANRVFDRIESLSQLSVELHNKNFSSLKNFNLIKTGGTQIDLLSKNIVDMGHSLESFYKNLQNIIDKKSSELKESLYIDGLTSSRNRKALEEDIEKGDCKVIIFLDIDKFSTINDFFGTDVGNHTLIEVSNRLKELAKRYRAQAYRIGSDQFAFVMFNREDDELLKSVIEKFSNLVITYAPDEIEINLDFTFGISKESSGGATIEHTDVALHEAKYNKLGQLVFSENLISKENHAKNIALSKKIRDGIKYDHFAMFYQPIYNSNREIVKYEALVRLKDGDRYLTPYHFLEYAQKTKYYFEITKIVIDKSFERFENNSLQFSVNLSAGDIVNKEVADYIEERVKRFHTPSNVTFEILESEHIEQVEIILDFIERVRSYGVKIAIDDFGSGYSNFSYLLDIKPDYLKIDGSIMKGISTNRDSYLVAKTITEFAKVSNFEVIGEFIDSEEVLQKAIDMGVDMFQGYYLSQPLKDI